MPECPYCSAALTWESVRETSPAVDEAHYRCPNPDCETVAVRITGVDV